MAQKKLTNKQIWAVKETIKQWQWYKKNPDKYKSDYPLLDKIKTYVQDDCFLCEYFGDWQTCGHCPLNTPQLRCLSNHKNDPYSIWRKSIGNHTERKKQCDRIISVCKKWLKKYDS